MAWPPGFGGGFPGGGWPGGFGSGFPGGFSGYPGGGFGGGFPGGGFGGGGPNLGPVEPPLNPTLPCTGATGQPMKVTIDTGAQVTCIGSQSFQRHFGGRVAVNTNRSLSIQGIGGGNQQTQGVFWMTLNVPAPNGQTLQITGEAWISPTLSVGCDVLLGMPFVKENNMSMTWDEGGRDFVEIQGMNIPLLMKNGS